MAYLHGLHKIIGVKLYSQQPEIAQKTNQKSTTEGSDDVDSSYPAQNKLKLDSDVTTEIGHDASEELGQYLILAVIRGKLNQVRACLENPDCDVNAYDDSWGGTPLMLAAERAGGRQGRAQIMRELLAHEQIEINKRDPHGRTVLDHAILSRWSLAVKLLVNSNKCDVNVQNRDGRTALMLAANEVQSGDDSYGKMVKLLITRQDIDVNLVNNNGETAIQLLLSRMALNKANFNACRFLRPTISLLADKSDPDSNRHTLAEAVRFYPTAICEILLKHGFPPDDAMKPCPVAAEFKSMFGTRHSEGRETAVHCAVMIDSLAKTKLLLEHDANLSIKWRGLTPLELAIAYNARPEILELLSKDMSKSEIAEAIEKCSMVGETVQECVMRLGVPDWNKLFEVCVLDSSVYKTSSKLSANMHSNNDNFDSKDTISAVTSCRGFVHSNESFEIHQEVVALIQTLAAHVSTRLPGLRFEPILAGSVAEGTKVYLPNEMDFMCVLSKEFVVQQIKGTLVLKAIPGSDLPQCINSTEANIVLPARLTCLLYTAIEFALSKLRETESHFNRLRLFKRTLIWCDKVSRLQLMWNGEEFQNMMISVDLAVCVRVDNATVKLIPHNIAKNIFRSEYFVICKSSRYHEGFTLMLSTSNMERQILNRLPINVKRGLILAKAVRIASIAKPDEDLSTAFCLAEDVHIDDLISSHMLKSCLIHSIVFNLSLKRPTVVAKNIYSVLHEQLANKHVLSWTGDFLLHCQVCQVEHSCCMKRKLMLAMTRKILQWLQDNEAQLQDIDYADGVDHCDVKTLVYRRSDVPEVWWRENGKS